MSELDATNLDAADDLSAGAGVDDPALAGQTDLSDDLAGDDADNPDGEEEEFEFDGEKLRVTKGLKEKLAAGVLRQADYTQKTQAVADARRQVEQHAESLKAQHEAQQSFMQDNAKLLLLDQQIDAFKDVDWSAAAQRDAADGTQTVTLARIELDRLKDERAKLAGDLKTKVNARNVEMQQATAKQIETRDAVLAKDVPNWAEQRPKVEAFAMANGISADELKAVYDPRVFKMMRLAMIGDAAEKQRTKTAAVERQQQVQPAASVRAASTPRTDMNRLGTDDWMKARREQIRKQGGRP